MESCIAINFKINVEKAKTITIGKDEEKIMIKIDARYKKQVELFKFLGMKLH